MGARFCRRVRFDVKQRIVLLTSVRNLLFKAETDGGIGVSVQVTE